MFCSATLCFSISKIVLGLNKNVMHAVVVALWKKKTIFFQPESWNVLENLQYSCSVTIFLRMRTFSARCAFFHMQRETAHGQPSCFWVLAKKYLISAAAGDKYPLNLCQLCCLKCCNGKNLQQTRFHRVKSAVDMPKVNIDYAAYLKCHKTRCRNRSVTCFWLRIELDTESADSLILTALVGCHFRTLHKLRKCLGTRAAEIPCTW